MARGSTSDANRPRPITRRSRVTMVGGFRRTALLAIGGLLLIAAGAGCFVMSLVLRPSRHAGAVVSQDVYIDPNNLAASKAEFPLDHHSGARYDLYLTVEEMDSGMGDYCQFDVHAYRGQGTTSRYVTYAYVYFGQDVVRARREGSVRFETYEMGRNVHVSSREESLRLEFTATSAWFTGGTPITGRIDVVEITPIDRLLLLSRSVLQVTTFPVGFAGVLLLWLSVMRLLRLIGVRVSPPPARKYEAPPGRKLREEQARAAEGGTP